MFRQYHLLLVPQIALFFLLPSVGSAFGAVPVVSDADLEISLDELRHVVLNAPKQIRSKFVSDPAARYEIIADQIVAKRIMQNLEGVQDADPALYYAFKNQVLKAAIEFDQKRFQKELSIPNFDDLAYEQWRASKNDLSKVPESRWLSHILLLCSEGCDESAKQEELGQIRQRLESGEPFADLAAQYSQDPGSRQRGGRLSRAITEADENIDLTFRMTAFELSEIGEVSPIVKSRFGFHIMRLELIEPEREYAYEEVRDSIIEGVEKRFREDAYEVYRRGMGPSDRLMISETGIESIISEISSDSP